MTILKLILTWSLFLLTSCTTAEKDVAQEVSHGMDKDDVLEKLGNPSRSKRVKGADRWSYDRYKGDEKTVTHVYFKKGKVTFVGRDDDLIKELKELSEQKKSVKQRKSKDFRDL